ncbi:MAG: hypothetical protein JRH15_15985 [Deltaproteobacteria bacterium]|nr:hypothetical protein [Deltaproteobacteria bacterium]
MKKSNLAISYSQGDKRLGIERRQFSYAACIPERRICLDRRCVSPLELILTVDEEETAMERFELEDRR